MARRDRRHGSGALLRWGPVVLVLAVLVAAGAAYRFDLGAAWFGTGDADPRTDPAAVAPPTGLTLPALTAPDPVATADAGRDAPLRARVRATVARFLDDADLGPHVVAAVGALDGTTSLVSAGDGPAIPASTTKLLTVTAALAELGPDHVFATTVVGRGSKVVLVGGGDPLLARSQKGTAWPDRADVATLARTTAETLADQGRRRVTVGYDDSLFSGPAVNPHWPDDYVPDGVVSPISALWVDEGRDEDGFGRVVDPSAVAAQEFAAALARAGVRVAGAPRPAEATPGAPELARVESAPLAQVVERVVAVSDNEAAEVLVRHVGLATTGTGSSRAGTAGVLRTLQRLGVRTTAAEVHDGSGLSRENLLTAQTLVDVLRLAASPDRPDLRAVLTGLPVAGFSGSLELRAGESSPQSRGRVRAKTGTLSGVSALAGVVTDRNGADLVFVVLADRVDLLDTLDAREALDDLAAALADCRCSR